MTLEEKIQKLSAEYDQKLGDSLRALTVSLNGFFTQLHVDKNEFFNSLRAVAAEHERPKKIRS